MLTVYQIFEKLNSVWRKIYVLPQSPVQTRPLGAGQRVIFSVHSIYAHSLPEVPGAFLCAACAKSAALKTAGASSQLF
jgi:hypothetical protein